MPRSVSTPVVLECSSPCRNDGVPAGRTIDEPTAGISTVEVKTPGFW